MHAHSLQRQVIHLSFAFQLNVQMYVSTSCTQDTRRRSGTDGLLGLGMRLQEGILTQFSGPLKEVHVPGSQTLHGRVCPLCPALWHAVIEQGILQAFHVCCDCKLTLPKAITMIRIVDVRWECVVGHQEGDVRWECVVGHQEGDVRWEWLWGIRRKM